MNDNARALFANFERSVTSNSETLGKIVRDVLGPELVARMTKEQHQELALEIEYAFHGAVTSFLFPFNNIGATLDPPFLGFRIVPVTDSQRDFALPDIGDGYSDYHSLWSEFSPPREPRRVAEFHERLFAEAARHTKRLERGDDPEST